MKAALHTHADGADDDEAAEREKKARGSPYPCYTPLPLLRPPYPRCAPLPPAAPPTPQAAEAAINAPIYKTKQNFFRNKKRRSWPTAPAWWLPRTQAAPCALRSAASAAWTAALAL